MLFQGILGHSKPTHCSKSVEHKETEDILKLAELLRIAVISGQVSCQLPVTSSAPQGPCWGPHSCMSLISTQGLGQIILSKPFKGTQQAGEMGKQESQSSAKRSAKSYTGGITLSTSIDWGLSSHRAALQRTASSLEPPQTPAAKKLSSPLVCREGALPASWGRGLFTLLRPPEPQLKRWVQFWAPQSNTEMGTQEWIQLRATKVSEWLEYLTDKENLGELDCLSCLEKRRLR